MGENNIANITTTSLANVVPYFSFAPRQTDGASNAGETYYHNPEFTTNLGYYKGEGHLKKAIDAFARYVVGKGYNCSEPFRTWLDNITGWGEDTFESICWNLIVTKKINGDAYAEIIREDKTDPTSRLVNLKPLDPSTMTTVADANGRIIRYEQRSKASTDSLPRELKPFQVLHLVNDRIADEIHGVSVIEACKWIIDAKQEAMRDWRRISHRSTIRVMYMDVDKPQKITEVKNNYAEAIKNGELLIIPVKKPDVEFEELTLPPIEAFLSWIKYLDNAFYMAVGTPRVVLGGSEEFTEASSKTALLTFNQDWKWEQTQFERDFYNQVYIQIKWNEPVSLQNELISDESKNTGQTGLQPSDTAVTGAGD